MNTETSKGMELGPRSEVQTLQNYQTAVASKGVKWKEKKKDRDDWSRQVWTGNEIMMMMMANGKWRF